MFDSQCQHQITHINITHNINSSTYASGNYINVFYVNIQSIRNKLNDLILTLEQRNIQYDIIVVVESWLFPNETNLYNIDGFNAYHNTRVNREGGGISMWVSARYNSSSVLEYDDNFNNFLMVHIKELNVNILGAYNTKTNDFLEKLDDILSKYSNCLMVSDSNVNLLQNGSITSKYNDIIGSNGYHILNKQHLLHCTRKTSITNTLIDHVVTDVVQKRYILSVDSHYFTDHESITIQMENKVPIESPTVITKPILNLPNLLHEFNLQPQSFNTYTAFHNKLSKHITENTTLKTIKVHKKRKLPYLNSEIKSLMKKRDKLYIKHKLFINNDMIKRQFTSVRNKVLYLLRKAKREYEANRIKDAGSDNRKLWQILNSCLYNRNGNNKQVPKLICDNNIDITDTSHICKIFNCHFLSIGINNHIVPGLDLRDRYQNNESFRFRAIDNADLINTVAMQKERTSPGYDNITMNIIKMLLPDYSQNFVEIINSIFESSIYPKELKISKIIPIYKQGKKCSVENYRPISILPSFSKIIETVIYNQLMNFLLTTEFFHPSQYGFLPKSGTEIANINFLQTIYSSLDENKITSAVFIDLSKAFDTVNRRLLIDKICALNISNDAIKLIASFLSERQQYTAIGDNRSSLEPSLCGVPQGSKLASLFFLIFVNDAFQCDLHGKMQLYADDVVISYSSNTLHELKNNMQHDLDTLETYFSKNLLSINTKKTKFIIFGKANNINEEIVLNHKGSTINKVDEITYLGLKINNKLNWVSHIDYLKNKIIPLVGALKRLKYHLPRKALIQIYFAHIYSRFNYLPVIWSYAPKYKIHQIKVLQNKTMKILMNKPTLTSSHLLYNKHFLSLENIIKYNKILIIHKIKNNLIRHNISLNTNSDIHRYNTRISKHIHREIIRTSNGKKAPLFQSIELYNEIPNNLKNTRNIINFKSLLREYITN